jgi:hypothetical protein
VLGEGQRLPKEERYPKVRQWYARDRGVTTLTEVVALLERAAAEDARSGLRVAAHRASGARDALDTPLAEGAGGVAVVPR